MGDIGFLHQIRGHDARHDARRTLIYRTRVTASWCILSTAFGTGPPYAITSIDEQGFENPQGIGHLVKGIEALQALPAAGETGYRRGIGDACCQATHITIIHYS